MSIFTPGDNSLRGATRGAVRLKNNYLDNCVNRIDEDGAGVVWIITSRGVVQWRDGRLVRAPELDAYLNKPKNLGYDGGLSLLTYGEQAFVPTLVR